MVKLFSVILVILFTSSTAFAGDPACYGKSQGLCDSLGAMINAKGKGCYRMMSVSGGGNTYYITCELSSINKSRISYVLKFSSDGTYTVR